MLAPNLLCDDVHHACHGVAAVERRLRALHDFDALDVLRVNQPEVVLAAHVAVDALAVDEDEDIAVAQSAQLHLAAHVALAEGKRGRQPREDFLDGAPAVAVEHLARDDFGLHGCVAQQVLRARARHHHLGQSLRADAVGKHGVGLLGMGGKHARHPNDD